MVTHLQSAKLARGIQYLASRLLEDRLTTKAAALTFVSLFGRWRGPLAIPWADVVLVRLVRSVLRGLSGTMVGQKLEHTRIATTTLSSMRLRRYIRISTVLMQEFLLLLNLSIL